MSADRKASREQVLLAYFRQHPDEVVNLSALMDCLPGCTPHQVRNAVYGLRRQGVPVQVVTPLHRYRYEPASPVKRDFGHGFNGATLRVLHKGPKRWICVDADGRAWFAYRAADDPTIELETEGK